MNTYGRPTIAFERGEGSTLWDTDNNKYLDALGGIAVCGLGHAHPAIAKTICEQASKLIHTSNLYRIPAQEKLADQLCELSGLSSVFFSNSGAEANEAAIKIARLFGNKKLGNTKGIHDAKIIVMETSFHGRTLATLSATGNPKVHAGFEPLVQGFIRVPYNDIEAIRAVAKNTSDVVAILVEPIQGEAGVKVPDAQYLNEIRAICDEQDWLMMLDEIQTGICRTGKWFAHQHNGIKPDVMTLAKSLGNGFPIGACLAGEKATDLMQPGNHGSTYGGNPLGCSVASTVIDTMQDINACKLASDMGDYMLDAFKSKLSDKSGVVDVRGKGMMIGIELNQACMELVANAAAKGLLINVASGNVIRLLPALTFTQAEADITINIVYDLINEFTAGK